MKDCMEAYVKDCLEAYVKDCVKDYMNITHENGEENGFNRYQRFIS